MKNELVELWGYAGYADILQQSSWIVRKIKLLNTDLKSLSKIPVSHRTSPSFLEKEAGFLATLPKLFNITVESLRYTQLITSEDRDFLFNHWWKPISSTPDLSALKAVNLELHLLLHVLHLPAQLMTRNSFLNVPAIPHELMELML